MENFVVTYLSGCDETTQVTVMADPDYDDYNRYFTVKCYGYHV